MPQPNGPTLRVNPIEEGGLLLDRVVDSLRESILSGDLAPGTRLSVPELARQLNVSRTPAREALHRLQNEGLVTVTPRRGAEVLAGRPNDLAELFEFREALEGMAARLAAKRMTPKEKTRLRETFEAHAEAVHGSNLSAHLEHDQVFHELFVTGARNKRISDELSKIRAQLTLITRTMSALPGALDEPVVNAHEAILTAIEASNAREAESAARLHVRGILSFYSEQTPERSAT
ncbi:MAG: GntR family transcriptional regulator [Rhodococcus sp. (in: high G+C Gram-positive bacteria)]|uniref:GntR family transcriptional regulator n=1 Tax=Rhodococcus sp. TaxID=1831 RepID=UPI003BAE3C82